ncbi:MAG TPA: hypothetical protein IAD38_05575 [Candidatus Egerieenecus merdigallinarum]|nr:hypothetical protein [Candidatus Egerieenecus merdigallinarum]
MGAYHIVYNPWLRHRMEKESALSHYNEMNVLSMHALLGAYTPEGEAWVEQLRKVLTGNVRFAVDYISRRFPGVETTHPQGTYMLFVDCSRWCEEHGMTIDQVERRCWDVGVAVQDGRIFHGSCHLRMNLALPRSRVEEALGRMEQYVFTDRA